MLSLIPSDSVDFFPEVAKKSYLTLVMLTKLMLLKLLALTHFPYILVCYVMLCIQR